MEDTPHPPGLAPVADSRPNGEALTKLGGLLSIASSNPYSQGLVKSDENQAVTNIEKTYKSFANMTVTVLHINENFIEFQKNNLIHTLQLQ